MKRAIKAAAAICLLAAVFALVSCATATAKEITIHDTETLKIAQSGHITTVYDLAGNAEYSFITRRVRTQPGAAENVRQAATQTETETIRIQTVYGILIITDKTTGEVVYIRNR